MTCFCVKMILKKWPYNTINSAFLFCSVDICRGREKASQDCFKNADCIMPCQMLNFTINSSQKIQSEKKISFKMSNINLTNFAFAKTHFWQVTRLVIY